MTPRIPINRRQTDEPKHFPRLKVRAPKPSLIVPGTAPLPGIRPAVQRGAFVNPVLNAGRGRDHGDPFVLEYWGTYFLYHTGRDGVHLYTSSDLVSWGYQGLALGPGPESHWAQIDFWAPEVIVRGGVFYMYVSATVRHKESKRRGDDKRRRLGLAKSLSPRGPFVWAEEPLVEWEWSIDGHPFQDDDGSLWMFYNVRTEATRYPDGTVGCGNVVGPMRGLEEVERSQNRVAFPSRRWEGNRQGSWYWNEGPFVLKRRGVYYQMYSGGYFGDETYGLSYATAPHPTGPWVKQSLRPILRSSQHILGPGHHCIVNGPDGVTPYAVYHGYLPLQRGRKAHLDRFFWAGDGLFIEGPTHRAQPVPHGPAFDPAVPHYGLSAWASGKVTVGGHSFDLGDGAPRHLRMIRRGGELEVRLEGLRVFCGPCTGDAIEGQLEGVVKTSWLDDETLYTLNTGEQRSWAWGGHTDLEVALAVKGSARVQVGKQSRELRSTGRFELVRLWVEGGAEALEVEALEAGVQVVDVVMTARSL